MSSEFFKNNPLSLHHVILYEYLQKKKIDESFKIFCERIEKNVIDFDQFKFWFDRFAEGKFDDEKEVFDLKMVLKNDKRAIRACILFEEERKQTVKHLSSFEEKITGEKSVFDPIFDSFKRMCKALRNDVIGYQEYYAYHQKFARKEFDLNDLEKNNNDKKALTLLDMPIGVMEEIGKKLNYYERCRLRKVSRTLREFLDTSQFKQPYLYISTDGSQTVLSSDYDDDREFAPIIEYHQFSPCLPDCHVAYGRWQQIMVKDSNHFELALNDVKILFKNPKFQLRHWDIYTGGLDPFKNFHEIFGSLGYKLQVESVMIKGELMINAISILQSLKPGYLKRIHLRVGNFGFFEELVSIMKMEQWKQAKCFCMDYLTNYPIENLFHFDKFSVGYMPFDMEDVKSMKNGLFNKPNFKYARFGFLHPDKINKKTLQAEFGNPIGKYSNIFHFPIPDSKDYIQISYYRVDYDDSDEYEDRVIWDSDGDEPVGFVDDLEDSDSEIEKSIDEDSDDDKWDDFFIGDRIEFKRKSG